MISTVYQIAGGDAGALETLHHMAAIAREAAIDPLVREVAAVLAWRTGTDAGAQARRLRGWLAGRVGFLRDPIVAEAVHRPATLIRDIAQRGRVEVDCDDVAVLAAALGMAIGLRARFVILGRDGWEHVFTELGDPDADDWFEFDLTRPFQGVGAHYPRMDVLEVSP